MACIKRAPSGGVVAALRREERVSAEVLDMENLVKVCKNLKAQRDTAVSKRTSSLDAHEKNVFVAISSAVQYLSELLKAVWLHQIREACLL
jgi:hypothetical protein